MKDLLPPHDPVEGMGEAYELLLENVLRKTHQGGVAAREILDEIRGEIVALNKFSGDEVDKLEAYVKRDLIDAAQYLDENGKELSEWIGFDVALIKRDFLERFANAADQTTVALAKLKLKAEAAGYQTGELTGLGTLTCDQCGEKLHFHKPGHIPPCPKCHGTHFHRHTAES
ncbi:MAG: zinc ribbon-containing protein [Sulfuriferula sp.]|nr:zinc ribbon-containing protein [Sulfuriferula sp.]